MKLKNWFSIIIINTNLFVLCAQEFNGKISGQIIEASSNEPLEFVNIALRKIQDGSLAQATISDKNGNYTFNKINNGTYFIQASFVGFETISSKEFEIKDNDLTISLPKIALKISSNVLGEVEITAEKALMETSIDKKTYNVGQDLLSKSGSASQILENIPSVAVDIDGNVSLRGLSKLTILINGRPSGMMKVNSAAALQQIPASTIEKIEIITNPSAKYKPDGEGGIINIILKKEAKQGFNGSVIANGGNDKRYNSTLLFNYAPKKFNISGSYGLRRDYRLRNRTDDRIIYDSLGNVFNTFKSENSAEHYPLSHTANLGLDYYINDKNTFGISSDYFYNDFTRYDYMSTTIKNKTELVTSDFNRDRINNEAESDKELSSYFEHKFKKEDHTIQLEFNIAKHFEEEKNNFEEIRRVYSAPTSKDNTHIQQWENSGSLMLEYVNPLSEDVELEAGASTEWFYQHFDFFGEYLDKSTNVWQKDYIKSNQFNFNQNLYSCYGTLKQSIDNFGYLIGFRAEHTLIGTEAITILKNNSYNYFKLYPSLHLSYETGDHSEVKLSYSKRINRPEGDELNPFPEYTNPRFISAGNPLLRPEQIHSVEFGYQYKIEKITIVPTVFYKYTFDNFTEINRYINDSTLLTTSENLATNQETGLEIIYSHQLLKSLTTNISGTFYNNKINASNLGYTNPASIFTGNGKIGISYNATKTTAIQVNANYNSPVLTPQGKTLSYFVLNLGLRQELFKNKASFFFTFSDILNTLKWIELIETPELYQKVISKRKSQIIYVGFSYRFGKAIKEKEELKFDVAK